MIGIFAIISIPYLERPVQPGLDPSWILGLHMSIVNDFSWGQDVVYTYGPLGYLYHPLNIDYSLWLESISFKLFSLFIFYLLLGYLASKTKNPLRNGLVLGSYSVLLHGFGPMIPYPPLIGIFLALVLYFNFNQNKFLLFPISLSSAFLFFMKFDVAVMSGFLVVISSIYLVLKKSYLESAILFSVYAISIILMGTFLLDDVSYLDDYFINSFYIAQNYSESHSTFTFATNLVYFALVGWIVFALIAVHYWKYDKKNLIIIFLSSFLLFAFTKLGFVREGHMMIFFTIWPFFFLIFITTNKNLNRKLKIASIFVILLFIIVNPFLDSLFLPDVHEPIDGVKKLSSFYLPKGFEHIFQIYPRIFDDSLNEQLREKDKINLKRHYSFNNDSILYTLENKTVNVYPWEISLAYTYDLNWKTGPTLQNYLAKSTYLDNLNAEFYEEDTAPDFILFERQEIDGAHPAFALPSTLRTIMCNYVVIEDDTIGPFKVLMKNDVNICSKPKSLYTKIIQSDERVDVPLTDNSIIFAKVHVKKNILGYIANIFYKSPHVFIQLNDNDKIPPMLLKYTNAENGLIMTGVTKFGPVPPILYGDINNFRIFLDKNFFENNIEVEFIEMKIDSSKYNIP